MIRKINESVEHITFGGFTDWFKTINSRLSELEEDEDEDMFKAEGTEIAEIACWMGLAYNEQMLRKYWTIKNIEPSKEGVSLYILHKESDQNFHLSLDYASGVFSAWPY